MAYILALDEQGRRMCIDARRIRSAEPRACAALGAVETRGVFVVAVVAVGRSCCGGSGECYLVGASKQRNASRRPAGLATWATEAGSLRHLELSLCATDSTESTTT
jgi:hypothetical protein